MGIRLATTSGGTGPPEKGQKRVSAGAGDRASQRQIQRAVPRFHPNTKRKILKSFHISCVGLSMANSPGTILLVEDDEQVRSLIRSLLSHDGYRVLEAATGGEGLEIAQRHAGQLDLLVSDMLLPELSGYDLAVKLRESTPNLKILFMTGYVEGEIVQRCISELGASFLDKPFQPEVLRARVREILSETEEPANPVR
jgi:CheY-like chemotaxis protein